MTLEALLNELEQSGWKAQWLEYKSLFDEEGSGTKVADALMHFWKNNSRQTLGEFARLLNGAGEAFSSNIEKKRFVSTASLRYVQAHPDPPIDTSSCLQELVFWDGCGIQGAQQYFDKVGQQLVRSIGEQSEIGAEFAYLLKTSSLSFQIKAIREKAVEAYQTALKGRIAMHSTPLKRVKIILSVASGVGGARIMNAELWDNVSQSCEQMAKAGTDQYIKIRDYLYDVEDGELLDHPRQTIANINRIIYRIDEIVSYGVHYDASRMLAHWRRRNFQDIPDTELVALFIKYYKENPEHIDLLKSDMQLLEGRAEKVQLAIQDGLMENNSERRKDGFAGRERKRKPLPENAKKVLFWGAVVLVLMLGGTVMGIFSTKNIKKTDEKPVETQGETVEEEDVEESPKQMEDIEETAAAVEPEKTEEALKTSEVTLTPEPSVSPEVLPTIEPTVEPSLTPEPTVEMIDISGDGESSDSEAVIDSIGTE